MSVHLVFGLLGAVAVPGVLISHWRSGAEKRAEEAGARQVRWISATWQSGAQALFGMAFVVVVAYTAQGGVAAAGSVTLVLAAGSRLSQYIAQTVTQTQFFRSIWLDVSRRLAWLENYAQQAAAGADHPAPEQLEGIRLDSVSFRYAGSERLVLDGVSLDLPAGQVIAVVGENGAGKSTLVKLLCGFYAPAAGTITVNGRDLSTIDPVAWRARLAGAFQDFYRFEYPLRQSVGVGDLPRIEDLAAVRAAIERAGAQDVVARLDHGLDSQLGPAWEQGADLSHGQWQKIALARGFMRDDPLLLVLDEPTSALDAEIEHALFERFAAAARAGETAPAGRITLLVSHRFSTVRMADLIVVLDGSRVADYGSHDELIGRGGLYAELYGIQAASYRAGYG
jgi:ATP-binding cassette, subfamily B, bacterial